jgi:hypothetical protein
LFRQPLSVGCRLFAVSNSSRRPTENLPNGKGVRQRIGAKYPVELLPLHGLRRQEAAGAKSWAKTSASQRRAIVERLSSHQFKPGTTARTKAGK